MARVQTTPTEEAVASEARKGYDLLVIGVEPTSRPRAASTRTSRASPEASRGRSRWRSPAAMQVEDPLQPSLDILVPVTGTEVSRRGAEVALALAQASGAPVTALYVSSSSPGATAVRKRYGGPRRAGEAILKEIVGFADQYGVPDSDGAPREHDGRGRHPAPGAHRPLLLDRHGRARRPGETLSFGNVAEAMLEASDHSLLFVAS